jgi:hypothetical protein
VTGSGQDLLQRRRSGILLQPSEEVLLQGLAGPGRALAQDGVDVIGNVLDLDAGHAARLAPNWRHRR